MKLECIEGRELRELDELWIVIDRDNKDKEFSSGATADKAWYFAAMRLQLRVNDVAEKLKAERCPLRRGDWDYIFNEVEDTAEKLKAERCLMRRAFGDHLSLVAEALRQIELVDGGDSSSPEDTNAIKKVYEVVAELAALREDAGKLIKELRRLGG